VGSHGDHHLAEAYRSQIKARIQLNDKSLQTFAATVEHLAHRFPVSFPVGFIEREAAHVLVNGMKTENRTSTSSWAGICRSRRPSTRPESAKAAAGLSATLRVVKLVPPRNTFAINRAPQEQTNCILAVWKRRSPHKILWAEP
jgi:hypothetical protein